MCQQQRRKIPSISQQKNNRCECCEALETDSFIHSSFQKEITFSTRLDQSYIEQHLTRDPVQYKTCKMKLATATLLTLLHQSSAFAPTPFTTSSSARSNTFKHSALVDPSIFADTHQHVDTLSNFFSSIILSDGDVSDSMNALADAATSAVSTTTTDATAAAASQDNGWFGFLEGPIEFLLQGIHSLLTSVGVSENAWGVSILVMTTFIKLLTYPLTKSQLESTSKMQVGYKK